MAHLTDQKMSSAYIAVTPDMAARWLERNAVNRKLRDKTLVPKYAADMASGRWLPSNDAICFGVDGYLYNGQHRLSAVVLSGVTVTFLVQRNMPLGSMLAMDQGGNRSASDALGFVGHKNTNVLAAVAKLSILYSDGRMFGDAQKQAVSHGEIVDFVDTHPAIDGSIQATHAAANQVDCSHTRLAASHFIISEAVGSKYADIYFDQLATRANEPSGSAVLAVDQRLREVRRNRSTYPPRNYLYLLIKGWNYYATDAPVKKLSMAPRGKFSIPTPVKWSR